METATSDWSSLPKELLNKIAKCLPTRIDKLRSRAICRKFRASIPLPPQNSSPFKALKIPYPIDPNPSHCDHLLLTHATFYAIEPVNKISKPRQTTKTWVVKVEESNTGKLLFKDPLLRYTFKKLSKLPKSLNLLDYRVQEVAKEYGIEVVPKRKARRLAYNVFNNELKAVFFKKVVVSTSLDEIGEGFAIMAIYTGGKLCVWRYGDKNWTNIQVGSRRIFFEDIAYHNNNFYALGSKGFSIVVDPKSLTVNEVAPSVAHGNYKYLVKSFNDLYLIDKHIYEIDEFAAYLAREAEIDELCPIHLFVFKLDGEKGKWVPLKDEIEDIALFLGYDSSFSLSAKEFSGLKSRCVYLTDDSFDKGRDDYPGWDVGIYCLEDGKVGPLSAFPGYSKIFWPPPTWLKEDSSSDH